jgi:hypothetical protein
MSDANLHVLEREVEAARAKLAVDLSILRSPATYSEFTSGLKREALDMKDTLIDNAKSNAQSTIEDFVTDLKARAAANPAAALVIGAGLAWRLIQRPPIASALIGAGLYGLFRTTPEQPVWRTNENYLLQAKDRLREQASDFADAVKERATAVGEAAGEQASELAAGIKDQASAATDVAVEKAADLTSAAKEKLQDWGGQARTSARQVSAGVAEMAGNTSATLQDMKRSSMRSAEMGASRATSIAEEWSRPVQETLADQESRDKLLLGAAGVAVIAALGLAVQRRMNESPRAD